MNKEQIEKEILSLDRDVDHIKIRIEELKEQFKNIEKPRYKVYKPRKQSIPEFINKYALLKIGRVVYILYKAEDEEDTWFPYRGYFWENGHQDKSRWDASDIERWLEDDEVEFIEDESNE